MKLTGIKAFHALSEILSDRRTPYSVPMEDIAPERLRQALMNDSASTLDIAVLLRQVLICEKQRRGVTSIPCLPAPDFLPDFAKFAKNVDLEIVDGQVRVLPWRPLWLPDSTKDPADQTAALERRRFGSCDRGPVADPFIKRVGHSHYRSGGQRAAIRSALLAPPGSTTAIVLPTGEGKSLVFQAIDEIGFASNPDILPREGVTVVVVPTVALAYDHERKYKKKNSGPLAYVGGSAEENRAQIRDRIEQGNQGLVFVAPEAACRSLRPALLSAARLGCLKAMVVDEAHLIDAWGTGFRTEFQSLSGLRRELIAASPTLEAPRTVLLSATLTPETFETLKDLFAEPGELKTLFAGQLRPEPDYWVASRVSSDKRNDRVIEALYHLPRPAILYVTEVKEAKAWEERLREIGYSRLASFHGQTPDHARRRTLERWLDGNLDLVVATSAFGLGIDYPHVRTVLHACVPETLDRFYQEVGRGGRDGFASISMTIPSHYDVKVARGLNQEKILTIERGLKRWKAIFEHRDSTHLHGTTFRLRIDIAPGHSTDDIDLVGEKNTKWNARLLSLLSRAGLIRLVGNHDCPSVSSYGDEEKKDSETVEILESDHSNESVWRERVEPVRAKIHASRKRNFELMLEHLEGKHCPSDLLLKLYGQGSLDPMCSECTVCRRDVRLKKPNVLRCEPAPCWTAPPLRGSIEQWLKSGVDVVIEYNPDKNGSSFPRRWAKVFDVFWKSGLRCLTIIGRLPNAFDRAIDELRNVPVFVSRTDGLARLPEGPRVTMIGSGKTIVLSNGMGYSLGRLLIIPENMPDVERSGEVALERFSGLVFDLNSFLARQV